MSKFEYLMAFETILYGLVLAHCVEGFGKMIFHRKTIQFYWAHVLAFVTIFIVVIQTYYTLFWVPAETVTSAWSFLVLRILPLTLLSVATYQIIPEKYKRLKSEKFFYKRLKEILIPTILFNILAVAKTVYYRWDQYLELGNGNIMGSLKFWQFVTPSMLISGFAFFMVFFYQKKRLVEAFVIFMFIMSLGFMTFAPTSK
ncbi:MAG: hypothetical protein R8G66_15425 [Cytophagales bacterium]|nr:hypothetical protein [Cytophagales bacterium]